MKFGHLIEYYMRNTRTKFMKQFQEIKQNWAEQRNFGIHFCVIFDY